jgi:hypothetical protein
MTEGGGGGSRARSPLPPHPRSARTPIDGNPSGPQGRAGAGFGAGGEPGAVVARPGRPQGALTDGPNRGASDADEET